jgi:hypothetical protein
MGLQPGMAFDLKYIVADLTTTLLRDLWDYGKRAKFLGRFASPAVDPGTTPFVGIGLGGSEGSAKILHFLTTVDGNLLYIKEFLSSRNWGGIHFEVIKTGRIIAGASNLPETVHNKARGGDRIERKDGVSGTLGCLVERQNGGTVGLSCHHVLTPVTGRAVGEEIYWSGLRLGTLVEADPLVLGAHGDNKIDAALIRPDKLDAITPGLRELGKIANSVADPDLGTKVKKIGAASGVSFGAIRLKSASIKLAFDTGVEAVFTDQLGIIGTSHKQDFAMQGDSGAIVVNDNNSAVGLLFGVSEGTDLAFANPIDTVLRRLAVRIQ